MSGRPRRLEAWPSALNTIDRRCFGEDGLTCSSSKFARAPEKWTSAFRHDRVQTAATLAPSGETDGQETGRPIVQWPRVKAGHSDELKTQNPDMATFVALLRGINVGSSRKVPMAALRELCVKRGLAPPETYIQSGNLIVDAETNAEGLRVLLERALKQQFCFAVDVVVRSASAWGKYIAANPFADHADVLPNKLHLYLSRDRLNTGAAKILEQRAQSAERIRVAGGALWIDYGANGVAGTKLSPALIDKACGSPATGRNWNSVLKIEAMIKARA